MAKVSLNLITYEIMIFFMLMFMLGRIVIEGESKIYANVLCFISNQIIGVIGK